MSLNTLVAVTCVVLVVGSGEHCRAQGPGSPGEPRGTRGSVVEELRAAEERFEHDTDASAARLDYAKLLLETGQFERARDVLSPLLASDERPADAVRMAARLAYFLGDFSGAQALYQEALSGDPGDTRALTGLILTYYQTNDFARCRELPEESLGTVRLPHLDLMRAFGEERPWQLAWDEGSSTSVPFVEAEPLPVIEVEVNGRRIAAIIDTGADLFILDSETAGELGIEPIASMVGMFAGGLQAEIGFAKADTLRIGSATLGAVPISLLPTKGLTLGDRQIEGIVGTAVLRQFLPTIDYPRGRLVLRARSEESRRAFHEEVDARVAEDIPFYIQGSHFLLAHGSLNGHGGLLFHIDSGLAGVPSFAAPEETLEDLGIPVPEVEVQEGVVGGGGGGFATGEFPIVELGLGRLTKRDLVGSFGGQPPGSYWHLGFILDGLISHNFLKDYAWTLDFDGMRLVFTEDQS